MLPPITVNTTPTILTVGIADIAIFITPPPKIVTESAEISAVPEFDHIYAIPVASPDASPDPSIRTVLSCAINCVAAAIFESTQTSVCEPSPVRCAVYVATQFVIYVAVLPVAAGRTHIARFVVAAESISASIAN